MHFLNGFLGTICSTGDVSLWSTSISDKKLSLLCTTSDESIRPTCIKLIDTTLNRFKEELRVSTADLATNVTKDVEKTKPISTTGKVIIEIDDNENDKPLSTSGNWKLEVSDDTDTEVVVSPKRKTPKKKRTTLFDDEVPQMSTLTQNSQTPAKKKAKVNGTKPIVVRSMNSDDDFEQSSDEKKRRSRMAKKKNNTFDETDVIPKQRKSITTQSQTKPTGELKNSSVLKHTAKKFKTHQPKPTNQKITKLTDKLNLSEAGSSHLMLTRKKKRKSV